MANDLERAVIEAAKAVSYARGMDVIEGMPALRRSVEALDATPPAIATREDYARAIWEADDSRNRWDKIVEWRHHPQLAEIYDRALRQADAVMALGAHLPLDLHGLPTLTTDMRRSADEDDAAGHHLQACHLRTGADELDRMRVALRVAVRGLDHYNENTTAALKMIVAGTDTPEDWRAIEGVDSK